MRVHRHPFAAVPGWVIDADGLTPPILHTYVSMASRLDHLGARTVSPDWREISADTGRSRSVVMDHLRILRKIGAVVNVDDGLFLPLDAPQGPSPARPDQGPGEGSGLAGPAVRPGRTEGPAGPDSHLYTREEIEPLESPGTPSGLPATTAGSEHLADAIALCFLLGEQLTARGYTVTAPPSKRWVVDMEQLLRIDGRERDEVERVLRWLDAGLDDVSSFWRTNVRSPSTLRAKWTVMSEQYQRARKAKAPRTGAQSFVERMADRFPATGATPGLPLAGRPESGAGSWEPHPEEPRCER